MGHSSQGGLSESELNIGNSLPSVRPCA